MPSIDRYFDEVDAARFRRAKELSEIKQRFGNDRRADPFKLNSKSVVVLAYANWEGFYNECVGLYVKFLAESGGKVREASWMLLVGAFDADFESLRARNHSTQAKLQFVADLKARLECGFESFDSKTVEAKSNLNFERLTQNYFALNLDIVPFQRLRIRLDKELVGWRHSVAHGDSPDLSAMDIAEHIDFVASLLIMLSDGFQYAMLERV